ncbi:MULTISPECIES: hypothetical protein [unclassified Microbacterium]|uniref:hypothetical protein n=1 Tax=unclassified Microbacterium TaxID=2609290 RepID=UPI0030101C18
MPTDLRSEGEHFHLAVASSGLTSGRHFIADGVWHVDLDPGNSINDPSPDHHRIRVSTHRSIHHAVRRRIEELLTVPLDPPA